MSYRLRVFTHYPTTLAYFICIIFFFNDTATTEIYTLSLHDALPICAGAGGGEYRAGDAAGPVAPRAARAGRVGEGPGGRGGARGGAREPGGGSCPVPAAPVATAVGGSRSQAV